MSPDWQREHEEAFFSAQEEAQAHFHRCQGCNHYVCDTCFNEEAALCTNCAPRQDVSVAQARADAMRRNIDEAGAEASVWAGDIEHKATVCPSCGKPAGSGKFCSHCGASMSLPKCPSCGAPVSSTLKFCPECGAKLAGGSPGLCPQCGTQNDPGTKFCGECGNKL
ncbi:MAG: zinc ribbon domain-containing protein [Eubacterium sp.]